MNNKVSQYDLNKDIVRFIKRKDKKGESYSKADIQYIQQFEGSALKDGKVEKFGVCEFYTPDYVCELLWHLAKKHGYKSGYVLEPSLATGRMIKYAPDESKCVGFEINPMTKRIAEISYPKATIHHGHFETAFMKRPNFSSRLPGFGTWLKQYPFSLVIGNPPFGVYKNKYSHHFGEPQLLRTEICFMYYGLQLLKKDGLLIYVTLSNFLRNGNAYNNAKQEIGKIAEFIDAYRLPGVFKHTTVSTDILIFKRK